MLTTEGTLLGGRVRYRQPAEGFRSGLEPVLLAASVPARPGQRVLEAGTGAGAALLCLCARVAGVRVTGIEIDPWLASLAAENAAANGFATIEILTGDIETMDLRERSRPGPEAPAALRPGGREPGDGFDHAIANAPYHLAAGTASPLPARERAKRGSAPLLRAWVARLAAPLRARGSLTLILPAAAVPASVLALEESGCPCSVIYPLWPRREQAAKLVLIRGIKLGRTPMRLARGLVLHEADGRFTAGAQAVLRDGAALRLEEDAPAG